MAMTRTQIHLTEEQRRQIQRLAEARHKTMAEVIREAVEEYMIQQIDTEDSAAPASRADPLRDIIGLGASGITDGSIHHDRDIHDDD